MNTEEKAKRYDEALEVCKKLYNEAKANEYTSDMEDYESIFPELKESEDERIRKELINYFIKGKEYLSLCSFSKEEVLAWLEKQGEQKPTLPKWKYKKDHTPLLRDSIILNKYGGVAKSPSGAIVSDVWVLDYDELAKLPKEEIEKQGKQKSANKVEPKFHEGEWIIGDKDNIVHQVKTAIENVSNGKYAYDLTDGGYISTSHESDYHLWTIKNAKDGDVLASELCDSIILFKGIEDNNIQFYCDYDFSEIDVPGDRFAINNGQHYGNVEDSKDFQPATKEQRNILMKAMAEAGYTFDFEKKELKKIERKSTWIEEDKKLTDVNHEYFSELLENNNSKNINDYVYQVVYCMSHDWANETPTWDDVQKACKLGAKWKEKHGSSKDWNEEDETNSYHLKTLLENLTKDIKHEFRVISDNDRDKYTAWLESLKERIGG